MIRFASWLNYPHCAEIQCHAHRVVAWPNGIVYQVIWATFWNMYLMFWWSSLSTRIYCFAQQNPFSFLRSEQFRRSWSCFSHSRGTMQDSCRLNAVTIETVDCHKTSRPQSESFSSLLIAYTPWQTAKSSQHSTLTEIVHREVWAILTCVAMNHSCVVRGCDHFQLRFFCGWINQIFLWWIDVLVYIIEA